MDKTMVITGTNAEEFQAEAAELNVQGYKSKHYDTYFNAETKQWYLIGIYESEASNE